MTASRLTLKDTNPKDAIGSHKAPASTLSRIVAAEIGLGMLEGACKYGRHNYRVAGVRASVYFDATMRHLDAWWEGEDIDPKSGLSHITKALSSLAVLLDAMRSDKLSDDRPPPLPAGWQDRLNDEAARIIAACPEPVAPYTARDVATGGEEPVPEFTSAAAPPGLLPVGTAVIALNIEGRPEEARIIRLDLGDTELPYRVEFDDGRQLWCKASEVRPREATK